MTSICNYRSIIIEAYANQTILLLPSEPQCKHLVEKYHVYLTKSGRISMCGVNTNNLDYLANAIVETVKTVN